MCAHCRVLECLLHDVQLLTDLPARRVPSTVLALIVAYRLNLHGNLQDGQPGDAATDSVAIVPNSVLGLNQASWKVALLHAALQRRTEQQLAPSAPAP